MNVQGEGIYPVYLQEVPTYIYRLACGVHKFRSLTPSEPGTDGGHWFACRRCGEFHCIDRSQLVEHPPTDRTGRKLSDRQLAKRIDDAILADRVASYYRCGWDGRLSRTQVAALLRTPPNLVRRVAERLGVPKPESEEGQ